MLRLLLDEHISLSVASGLRRQDAELVVHPLVGWRNGDLIGQDDEACIAAAASDSLTFVTYDRRTFPFLLKSWAEQGRRHAGVIFVDEKTVAPSDIGGSIHALAELAQVARDWDWTDRVCFLGSAKA